MNLDNSDKEFFENLFSDLSKKIGDSVKSTGQSASTGTGGLDSKAQGMMKTALAGIAKGSEMIAKGAFNVAVNQFDSSVEKALSFGEILSRSAVASGRASSLLGASINRSTKALEFGLPAISQEFRKFGFSLTDAARTLDSAIRANIKDTGMVTQRFLATSKGLGASMATTNKFLATQTNVLGTSTESSVLFGQSILGLASSNGILADSILDAVNAFTKTTREQKAIFGAQSAQVVAQAVAGAEGLVTGAGTVDLIRALTSPENILKIPALAGRLGITPVTATDLRDPARMKSFLMEAIPALASFAEREVLGAPAESASALLNALRQRLGSAFELVNLDSAVRVMEELGEKGQGIGAIFEETILSQQKTKESQDLILATNMEAAKAAATFNLELAIAPSYFKAIAKTNSIVQQTILTSAEKMRAKLGDTLDKIAAIDAPMRFLGLKVTDLANTLIGVAAGILAAMKLIPGFKLPGGPRTTGVPKPDRMKPATRPDPVQPPKQRVKIPEVKFPGRSNRSAGNAVKGVGKLGAHGRGLAMSRAPLAGVVLDEMLEEDPSLHRGTTRAALAGGIGSLTFAAATAHPASAAAIWTIGGLASLIGDLEMTRYLDGDESREISQAQLRELVTQRELMEQTAGEQKANLIGAELPPHLRAIRHSLFDGGAMFREPGLYASR